MCLKQDSRYRGFGGALAPPFFPSNFSAEHTYPSIRWRQCAAYRATSSFTGRTPAGKKAVVDKQC